MWIHLYISVEIFGRNQNKIMAVVRAADIRRALSEGNLDYIRNVVVPGLAAYGNRNQLTDIFWALGASPIGAEAFSLIWPRFKQMAAAPEPEQWRDEIVRHIFQRPSETALPLLIRILDTPNEPDVGLSELTVARLLEDTIISWPLYHRRRRANVRPFLPAGLAERFARTEVILSRTLGTMLPAALARYVLCAA